jgi:predicted PurR-regulated permease PerM
MKAVWLVALVGVGTVLYLAQDVMIPVAMALFLAMLLTPAVDRLQRFGIRRGIAVGVVMAVVLGSTAAAVNAVWTPATEWLASAPQNMRKIAPRLKPVREMFDRVDAVAERAGSLTQGGNVVAGKPAIVTPVAGRSTAVSLTKSFLEALTVIPLTLFFLSAGRATAAGAAGRIALG